MVKGAYNNSDFKQRRKELRVRQTEAEKILWEQLRGRKLEKCKFWRQYSVGPYVLDFYCPQIRFAIEVDGDQHESAKEYDRERAEYLEGLNILVIRFWNSEVLNNMQMVSEKIRKTITLPNLPLTDKREEKVGDRAL